jgi:large subunit ribosomal protein L29
MKYKMKQLKQMTEKELQDVLKRLRGELRQFRFLSAHGEMKQVHQFRETRKTMARILTISRQNARQGSLTETKEQA